MNDLEQLRDALDRFFLSARCIAAYKAERDEMIARIRLLEDHLHTFTPELVRECFVCGSPDVVSYGFISIQAKFACHFERHRSAALAWYCARHVPQEATAANDR